MSDLTCGQGFLTLNQSILIVVVAAVLVVIAAIAVVVVSVQYNKVIKIVQTTAKQMLRPAITPHHLDEAQREEINRRKSLIPRPLVDSPEYHQGYARSHSLPGLAGYGDPRSQQPRYPERGSDPRYFDPRNDGSRFPEQNRRAEVRRQDPRNAEPRMVAAGGQKKISEKPRDEGQRSKPSNNNRDQPQQEQPSAGKKIPMKKKEPEKTANRSGSKDWGQDSFPLFPENERGKQNPFYQESGFSDNFGFGYPNNQPRMSVDGYF